MKNLQTRIRKRVLLAEHSSAQRLLTGAAFLARGSDVIFGAESQRPRMSLRIRLEVGRRLNSQPTRFWRDARHRRRDLGLAA